MFTIETNTGKSIRGISYFQHEDEILLPPGRYLRVINKWSPVPDLHIIHLREIKPPYKMLADPFDLSQVKHVLPQVPPVAMTVAIDIPLHENSISIPSSAPESKETTTVANKTLEKNSTSFTSIVSESVETIPFVDEQPEKNSISITNAAPESVETTTSLNKESNQNLITTTNTGPKLLTPTTSATPKPAENTGDVDKQLGKSPTSAKTAVPSLSVPTAVPQSK